MKDTWLPENIKQARPARLIPVGAATNYEGRATSALLAMFMGVPEYAQHMLNVLNITDCKVTSRSQIRCFTEITFQNDIEKELKKHQGDRPDGLIVIRNGKKQWSVFIEAKIKNNKLEVTQVERYLELARKHGVNAVITISNEYANIPSHHPVKVNGQKTRTVSLHHWSWHSLLTEALMHTDDKRDVKDIEDPTQRFLLSEFAEFLAHDSTGVMTEMRMSDGWAAICKEGGLDKKTEQVEDAVMSWHNLSRELSLKLSQEIQVDVTQSIPRKYNDDKAGYNIMLKDDVDYLVKHGELSTIFLIKDAAAPLHVDVNMREKIVIVSSRLKTSKDMKSVQSAVSWLSKQLKKASPNVIDSRNVYVKACYKGANSDQPCSFEKFIAKGGYEHVKHKTNQNVPHTFEVYLKLNLKLSELKAVSKFPETIRKQVQGYYEEFAQHFQKAQNKAPQVPKKNKTCEDMDELGDVVSRAAE